MLNDMLKMLQDIFNAMDEFGREHWGFILVVLALGHIMKNSVRNLRFKLWQLRQRRDSRRALRNFGSRAPMNVDRDTTPEPVEIKPASAVFDPVQWRKDVEANVATDAAEAQHG